MIAPKEIPESLQDVKVQIEGNAKTVFHARYVLKDGEGNEVETPQETCWRIATNVAKGQDLDTSYERAVTYFRMLAGMRFLPNTPTWLGAGTEIGQLAACFVLDIPDKMSGIFKTLNDAALIQQSGGGNGFAFSDLRPKNALVRKSMGKASGPVSFLRVYDNAFNAIAQGGKRRGANMGVLRVDHPDIEEFVGCKKTEEDITNFNISVGMTDAFMEAVQRGDESFDLMFGPDKYGSVNPRELFDTIAKKAHANGEPGMLFLDAANRENPVPHLYTIKATNPCGEQFLGPFENCCLGSINLSKFVRNDGRVYWDALQECIEDSTMFLDDVVSANAYIDRVPELREAAHKVRRIGLGIMGLADAMIKCGVRYGSREGCDFASQIMEFVRYHTMRTSIRLAAKYGPFPAIKGSLYDPDDFQWIPPKPLYPHSESFGRPALDWEECVYELKEYGIRNGCQNTIAPTGTIATVSYVEGYGCEPVFALAYGRYMEEDDGRLELSYTSPLFQEKVGVWVREEDRQAVIEAVASTGSCQNVEEIPEELRDVFVVSADVSPENHIKMQASLQAFVDNSISKTINLPREATVQDVKDAYMLAWKLGCKGLTVYRTGSRDKVVLELGVDKERTNEEAPSSAKERPKTLKGTTRRITTPLGNTYITINEDDKEPFEMFIQASKAGSTVATVTEALARLVSYLLRIPSSVPEKQRLLEIAQQLKDIGGGTPTGFGPNKVLSLPDGIAKALMEYLKQEVASGEEVSLKGLTGDICPECGEATLLKEEGCVTCRTCGYGEC